MALTSVLVAETAEEVLAEIIAESIRREPDMVLHGEAVIAAAAMDRVLLESETRPEAVIIVGDREEIDGFSRQLLTDYPNIIVVRVAIANDMVNIDLRKLGLRRLIASVRALAEHPGSDPDERLVQYRVIAAPEPAIITDHSVVPADRKGVLANAVQWIDAALLLYLRGENQHRDDLPGLTLSQGTVESLVLPRHKHPALAPTETREAAEAALVELIAALDGANPAVEPLAAAWKYLGLTVQELQALLLCLAPEIDYRYQRVFGYISDNLGQRNATVGLVCSVLGEPTEVRRSLTVSNGLGRWRLLAHGFDLWPSADEPLRLDSSVLSWILGHGDALWLDPRLRRLVRKEPWIGANWLQAHDDRDELLELLSADSGRPQWILLAGDDASGWRALIERLLSQLESPFVRVGLAGFTDCDPGEIEETAIRLARAAALLNAILILDTAGPTGAGLATDALGRLLGAFPPLHQTGLLIAPDVGRSIAALPPGPCHVLHRKRPDAESLSAAFVAAAQDAGLELAGEDAARLALAYPFSLEAIDQAINLAVASGARGEPAAQQVSQISAACRRTACRELPHFAQRVEPCFSLDQVILPAEQAGQLREIVTHVRHARVVMDSWGFGAQLPYGRGVTALFFGPSGTGKTMAAQAIARALDTEIFAVDLSQVVSKYIGETEKNLDCVFSEAQRGNAVLVFNEADALFGKRSEVKDSHDLYANQQVAFLLQRVETFDGVAILTTNFREGLDKAFVRRLRFLVEFPKPDSEAREAIWRQCFPHQAPQSDDIDFRFLAKRLELTGGNIRKITLRAAFNAANEHGVIAMKHIVDATCAELTTLGMPGAERELKSHARFGLAERVA